jgi:S-methylmethionine-dependent homocysteine/selenocysteine methylase
MTKDTENIEALFELLQSFTKLGCKCSICTTYALGIEAIKRQIPSVQLKQKARQPGEPDGP